MADKAIQRKPVYRQLVSVESNTETLLWYENQRFAEYTAVEHNTACETIEFRHEK